MLFVPFLLALLSRMCLWRLNFRMLFQGVVRSLSLTLRRFSLAYGSMSRPVGRRVAWTSSVSLTRFVWVIQHGSGLGPRAECSRAALAVWLRKLDLSTSRAEDDPSPPSAEESMLDWLVASVRLGWTPREVLAWFFTVFGDLLYLMISDVGEEG